MQSIIIDNCVVSSGNGTKLRVQPFTLLQKYNVRYEHLPTFTLGSRLLDNKLITQLIEGDVDFIDIYNQLIN